MPYRKELYLPGEDENTKMCRRCQELFPRSNFRKNNANKDGLAPYCKPCDSAKAKEWQENNKERVRANKYAARWKRLGIVLTKAMVLAKLKEQKYACSICGDDLHSIPYHYDHDHDTMKLRDILCESCNKGLGFFNDDPYLLDKAARYLRRHHGLI